MADREIIEAIQQLVGAQLKDVLGMVVASVDSVNEDERTCACTAISGVAQGEITGVQLMADIDDGALYVPAIGSTVILMYSIRNVPFVAMYSQLSAIHFDTGQRTLSMTDDLITFNDGLKGGLTNTITLREQLEKTNELLNNLLTIINGPPIPEPGSNAPSALQAALSAAIAGQELGTYGEIEDTTIIH